MAKRQEQESASEEVTEVAQNVLRMQLPISMPGLGHVNCYALIDGEGAALVDPGLPGNASWKALLDRLGKAGLKVRDVHTVLVTHSHPDHFGGAYRLHKEAGAEVVAHRSFGYGWATEEQAPETSVDDLQAQEDADAAIEAAHGHSHAAEREVADAADPEPDIERPRSMPRWGGPTPWGGEAPRPPLRSRMRYAMMRMFGRGYLPPISKHVDHGDMLELAGREWFVLHTPGHTEDHICFHDPDLGAFAAGDHVLPSITPHISGMGSGVDPLKSFFYSLDRVGEIRGVKDCLPAHGHPFADLRARTEAIKRHHDERLDRVKEISREIGRPATVEQFTQKLFKKRSWGPMADSETFAHLEHLRHLGEAESYRDDDGKLVFHV